MPIFRHLHWQICRPWASRMLLGSNDEAPATQRLEPVLRTALEFHHPK
jgi:hypothetical protein